MRTHNNIWNKLQWEPPSRIESEDSRNNYKLSFFTNNKKMNSSTMQIQMLQDASYFP